MAKKEIKRRRRIERVPKNCYFCKEKKEISLGKIEEVKKFLTERGKILPRSRNGLCAKHQNDITRIIKQGRILALLSFVVR